MIRRETIALLRALIRAIDELSDIEFDEVIKGEGRLAFVEFKERLGKTKLKTKASFQISPDDLKMVAQQLKSSITREEAIAFLHQDGRTILKENLVHLAKILGIHVEKNDKRELVEQKIVEFVVGTKLRSEAIRSLSLKGQ